MTTVQLKENIDDSLVRLKRHYDACVQGYDRALFKDLAHTLRLWVDMKKNADYYLTVNRPASKFISYSILPVLNKMIREDEYLVVYFPRFVKIGLIAQNENVNYPVKRPMRLIGKVSYDSRPDLREHEYTFIDGPFIDSGRIPVMQFGLNNNSKLIPSAEYLIVSYNHDKFLRENGGKSKSSDYFEIKKVKFGAWLDSTAIRMNVNNEQGKLEVFDISREVLIQRMANILGASHPEGGVEIKNKFDAPIRSLMEYKIFQTPLPYLALIKFAHDILEQFDYLKK